MSPRQQSELEKIWVLGEPTISSPGIDVAYGEPIIAEMPDDPGVSGRGSANGGAWAPTVTVGKARIQQLPPAWDLLMQRGLSTPNVGAQPANPFVLPRSALSAQAQRDLPQDAQFIDISKITPAEKKMLPFLIDPVWLKRQQDPGYLLTEEEKAKAKAKAGVR